MLTKTIGQLDSVLASYGTDKIEVEQSGVSKYASVNSIISGMVATTAESLLGTSNEVIMTPVQVREAFSANNSAPMYACRAWVNFDGTTTSSSISGTYTRLVGTTQTVCVATTHGMITGNMQYIDFVTGGGSANSYLVTVVDQDTFTVNTVSTSSILTSTLSLKRCPILAAGNINSVSRPASGQFYINFSTAMPSAYYSVGGMAKVSSGLINSIDSAFSQTDKSVLIRVINTSAGIYDPEQNCIQVFA